MTIRQVYITTDADGTIKLLVELTNDELILLRNQLLYDSPAYEIVRKEIDKRKLQSN